MAMNGRLLRPRQTIHPEAADWANRVRTNGGTVSGTTLSAVDRFVKATYAAGIRDRFYRLNLFCGNSDANLNAVRTPLFRGPSLTGTQWGNTTDVNSGLVQGDYTETGTGGGLNGGTAKHLQTGVQPNAAGISAFDSHIAFYSRAEITANATALGGFGTGVTQPTWQTLAFGGLAQLYYRSGGASNAGIEAATWSGANRSGHIICVRTASNAAKVYRNGSDLGLAATVSNTNTWTASDPAAIYVFGRNNNGTADQMGFTGKLQGYSLGRSMTDAQASAYYAAIQAFQTALGRQL